MNRFTQLVALSILMAVSSLAFADRDHNRGHSYGQYNDHRGQQYGRNDHGAYNNRHGNKHRNKYAYKSGHKHAHKNRHANRKHDRHHDRYQSRRHAQHGHHRYRHKHNGRYCYVRHAPGYAGYHGARVVLPAPPMVAFPPRPRLYIGGTIVF